MCKHSSHIHVISKSRERRSTISRLLESGNYQISLSDEVDEKARQHIIRSHALIIDCIESFEPLQKLQPINNRTNNILALIKATYSNKKYIYAMGALDYISSPPTQEEILLRLQSCNSIEVITHTPTPPTTICEKQPWERNRERQLAKAVTRVLSENISAKHTLNALAREIGTNRNSLCIAFQNVYGQSVFSWLREQRMHKAARLLKETSASIQTICTEIGYNTPANFSTAFKRHFGTSPRQYRKE